MGMDMARNTVMAMAGNTVMAMAGNTVMAMVWTMEGRKNLKRDKKLYPF